MWEARHYADRKPESDKPERARPAQPLRVNGTPLLPRACSTVPLCPATEVVLRSTAGKLNSWLCFGGEGILPRCPQQTMSKLSIRLAWAH